MSLESEIKNLTGAMTRLAEAMEAQMGQRPLSAANSAQGLGAQSTAAPQSVVTPPAETKQEIAAQAPALQQTAAALTLEDIKKALMATAAKFDAVTGTAKSKAILSRFGAQKLSQVPVESYAEFVALCESVAAGGEA